MYPVKRLDGSTDFHLMDFKISATVIQDQAAIADVLDSDLGGSITDATTTSLLDFVGSVAGASSYNRYGGGAGTLTYSVTQADTEGLVRVFVNPDAIYRAAMWGGATAADLQTVTTTAASAAGTTITATDTPDNDMDDGTCWCLSGANAGLARRVETYTANTSWVVIVPFPRAIAIGDTFAIVPYTPCVTRRIQLSTNLVNANATIAMGTGGQALAVELVLEGVGNSYVHFIARDHCMSRPGNATL